jgi:hypothetical protein
MQIQMNEIEGKVSQMLIVKKWVSMFHIQDQYVLWITLDKTCSDLILQHKVNVYYNLREISNLKIHIFSPSPEISFVIVISKAK